jgi:hypothetical protein
MTDLWVGDDMLPKFDAFHLYLRTYRLQYIEIEIARQIDERERVDRSTYPMTNL